MFQAILSRVKAPQSTAERFAWAAALLGTGATIGGLAAGRHGAYAGALVAGFAGALAGHLNGPQWRPFGETLSVGTLGLFVASTLFGTSPAQAAVSPPGQLPVSSFVLTPSSGQAVSVRVGDMLDLQFPSKRGQYWLIAQDADLFEQAGSSALAGIDRTVLKAVKAGASAIKARLINFDGTFGGQDYVFNVTVV